MRKLNNNNMNKTAAYIKASRFYLTEELPTNLFDLGEQEIMDFIQDRKWQPFEYWQAHEVWELIEGLAEEFQEVSNQK
jgi:hypothetical protein